MQSPESPHVCHLLPTRDPNRDNLLAKTLGHLIRPATRVHRLRLPRETAHNTFDPLPCGCGPATHVKSLERSRSGTVLGLAKEYFAEFFHKSASCQKQLYLSPQQLVNIDHKCGNVRLRNFPCIDIITSESPLRVSIISDISLTLPMMSAKLSKSLLNGPCSTSKCGSKMTSHIPPTNPSSCPDSYRNDTNTSKSSQTAHHDPPTGPLRDISSPQRTDQESTTESDIE